MASVLLDRPPGRIVRAVHAVRAALGLLAQGVDVAERAVTLRCLEVLVREALPGRRGLIQGLELAFSHPVIVAMNLERRTRR